MSEYTPNRLQLELRVANAFLHLLDEKSERTYAHTCCDMYIGRFWNKRLISGLIRNGFVAARGPQSDRPVGMSRSLDLMSVGCYFADGRTFRELRDEISRAQGQVGWLICVIHGVGAGSDASFLDSETHEELLSGLSNQHETWVRSFIDVANWIREWQAWVKTP